MESGRGRVSADWFRRDLTRSGAVKLSSAVWELWWVVFFFLHCLSIWLCVQLEFKCFSKVVNNLKLELIQSGKTLSRTWTEVNKMKQVTCLQLFLLSSNNSNHYASRAVCKETNKSNRWTPAEQLLRISYQFQRLFFDLHFLATSWGFFGFFFFFLSASPKLVYLISVHEKLMEVWQSKH